MSTFGRNSILSVGRSLQVCADGNPIAKVGGVTIDWSAVSAAAVAATYQESDPVDVGEKFLRYGQVVTKISASGLYGPYASGASDGRQTLTRGECFILNESQHENQPHSDHPPVIDGGRVWKNR